MYTEHGSWDILYRKSDEGELAISRILHIVAKLRELEISDPDDGLEVTEDLDDLFYAAKALRAYISGLKARRA